MPESALVLYFSCFLEEILRERTTYKIHREKKDH